MEPSELRFRKGTTGLLGVGGKGRVEREKSARSGWETSGTDHGSRSEDNVAMIGEVRCLLGVELTAVQGGSSMPHCSRACSMLSWAHIRSPESVKVIQPQSNSLSI